MISKHFSEKKLKRKAERKAKAKAYKKQQQASSAAATTIADDVIITEDNASLDIIASLEGDSSANKENEKTGQPVSSAPTFPQFSNSPVMILKKGHNDEEGMVNEPINLRKKDKKHIHQICQKVEKAKIITSQFRYKVSCLLDSICVSCTR